MIGHYTSDNKQSCQLFNIFRSSPSVFLLQLQSSRRVGLMPQHSCCHSTSTDNLLWKGLFPVEVTPQLLLQVIDIIVMHPLVVGNHPQIWSPCFTFHRHVEEVVDCETFLTSYLRMTSSEGEVAWHGLKVTATSAHARTNHLGSAHAQALVRACALLRELIN